MKRMVCREYQSTHVKRIINQLLNRKCVVDYSCTASGKTATAKIVISELLRIKKSGISKVIVLTPLEIIAMQYMQSVDESWEHGNPNASNKPYLVPANLFNVPVKDNIKTLLRYLKNIHSTDIKVVTHALIVANKIKEYLMSQEDLSHLLVVVDETHRCFVSDDEENKLGTQLGEIVNLIVERGGLSYRMSATPWREKTGSIVPVFSPYDVYNIGRTLGEQMRDGYAPKLKIEYKQLKQLKLNVNNIFTDKMKSKITSSNLRKIIPDIIEQWCSDGYPKGGIIIPAGLSTKNAAILKELLEKVEFPEDVAKIRGRKSPNVLNAVGANSGDANRIIDDIRNDTTENGQLFDICIACRRFDEGSDLPSISNLYIIGLPSIIRLILQRLGRAMRNKLDIEGYKDWFGDEFIETSKIVFFIPPSVSINDIGNQAARQLLHCILASEAYELYDNKISSSTVLKSMIQSRIDNADESLAETLDNLEHLFSAIELSGSMNYSHVHTELLSALTNRGNLNLLKRVNRVIETEIADETKLERIFHLIDMSDLRVSQSEYDKLIGDIINDVDTNATPRKLAGQVIDNLLHFINEFEDSEIKVEISDKVSRVMSTITGNNLHHWSNVCKIGLSDDDWKEATMKKYKEWKDIHGQYKYPSHTSSDPEERELARFLAIARREYKELKSKD
jgi:superfamily II DNA or RNA helicase